MLPAESASLITIRRVVFDGDMVVLEGHGVAERAARPLAVPASAGATHARRAIVLDRVLAKDSDLARGERLLQRFRRSWPPGSPGRPGASPARVRHFRCLPYSLHRNWRGSNRHSADIDCPELQHYKNLDRAPEGVGSAPGRTGVG